MHLVSYGPAGAERPGIWIGERIFDLALAWPASPPPTSVRALLELPRWKEEGASAAARAAAGLAGPGLPVTGVRLGAPVPNPSKVIAIGANTWSHLREAAQLTHAEPSKSPFLIAKAPSAVIGPQDAIVHPPETGKLDYEVELGVIIGRTARRVPREQAFEHVAGYTVASDVTARDVQLAEGEPNAFFRQHFWGKSFDTFCPTGPCLVTADEVADPTGLSLQTLVNGELRQSGEVSDLIYPIEQLIEEISRNITLLPGDLILTGSPAGVGFFMHPPGFLKPGDMLVSRIPGIGQMANPVVADGGSIAAGAS